MHRRQHMVAEPGQKQPVICLQQLVHAGKQHRGVQAESKPTGSILGQPCAIRLSFQACESMRRWRGSVSGSHLPAWLPAALRSEGQPRGSCIHSAPAQYCSAAPPQPHGPAVLPHLPDRGAPCWQGDDGPLCDFAMQGCCLHLTSSCSRVKGRCHSAKQMNGQKVIGSAGSACILSQCRLSGPLARDSATLKYLFSARWSRP